MASHTALSVEQLYRRCDPAGFDFDTTAQLSALPEAIGQHRATAAVRRAARIGAFGYNVYALGSPRTTKRDAVRHILEQEPAETDALRDWLYFEDLEDGRRPIAIELAPGLGRILQRSFTQFIDDLRATLPGMFEDEAYQQRSGELMSSFQLEQKERLLELQQQAEAQGLKMLQTPNGFAFAPVNEQGEVLEPEAFQALSPEAQQAWSAKIDTMNAALADILRTLPRRQQSLQREQLELARERGHEVLHDLTRPLRRRFQSWPEVLLAVERTIEHVIEQLPVLTPLAAQGDSRLELLLRRYRPNLLVDNSELERRPVVHESNPTVENLIGSVQQSPGPNGPIADVSMISAGSLHHANGGFLLVDAERLLARPLAWDALKRALIDGEIRIEAPAQLFSLGLGYGLSPQSIPLRTKVVLLGSRLLYYLLCAHDPDFESLFRIAAEFEDDIPWDVAAPVYPRLVAAIVHEHGLRAVDRAGVARVIEFAARQAGDNTRLTTHTATINDVLIEADFEAGTASREVIGVDDVQRAIEARAERLSGMRERVAAAILDDVVLIRTEGTRIGQINGLSVLSVGTIAFGQPSRISATARPGSGGIVDIERMARLGGNIHTKGLMIVSAWLGAVHGAHRPPSMRASLVFEQSYGGVDGDSASVAEVCALLSAIGELPLRQDLAVTGSMNQHGEVQAIGGVNEKIEGFFRICSARGLCGQGVIIPRSNVRHLMLDRAVCDAVARGEFSVHAIDHIDQALTLFTGLPAGAPDAAGGYPPDSVHGRVAERLEIFARAARETGSDDVADPTPLAADPPAPPADGPSP